MSSIIFKNVCKDYGNTQVVKNLNLEINPGERLVLLGPSGCGKSTTLRMIAGLEKITSGELYFGDKLMNDIEAGERNVAMVFQNYALYPHMTVWDNITFGLRMNKLEREEIEKRAKEALKILNLEGLEKRYSKELSGGQRQRVALCRAVVKQSPFFLLDEPLSNLDVQLRNSSREELVKLHNLYRPTFVYVTHDQIEAMTIGHRIAVLNKGYLQQIDTPEKIYNNPVNIFVAKFIGIPQINMLRVNINEGDILFKNNRIKLSDEKRKLIEKRSEVYLGIRPEYVKVSRDETENSMKGNIAKIENYGSQKCLLITVNGGEKVIASVPNDSDFKRYEDVYIKFSKKNMLFFDIATENNIEME
ncbi:ABC transporter ATP-binding protein [Fusobacterium varium]|uniref:ABC transporter ATP-binding protein n=1 Tax=Fusobacterium varium TaxID=856 RepID=UPI003565DD58